MLYRFSDCVVDTKQHRLYHDGEPVDTGAKVFDVLLFLLQRRGELVTRDMLLEQCWPGMYVSEETLTRCISRIRRAVKQNNQRKLIETVHRKGYRFVGEVQEQAENEQAPARQELDLAEVEADAPSERSQSPQSPAAVTTALESTIPDRVGKTLSIAAERRQLTVVNCRRVAGNSEQPLGVQELYEQEHAFREQCQHCVDPLGGHLEQWSNDGFMVYFGYPQAQEDSARRAVLAGLKLVERQADSVGANAAQPGLCVGIHSGLIIVGPVDGETTAVLTPGPSERIAIELSERALGQAVLVSEVTAKLIEGHFDCQLLDREADSAQGESTACYQVVGERSPAEVEPAASDRQLTPFIGREAQLALLAERWSQVREGLGQVVLLSGDPGVGKSRLVMQVTEQIVGASHPSLVVRCSAYHQHTAFFPMLVLLRRLLRLQNVASGSGERERLEALAELYRLTSVDGALPLLAQLLSIEVSPECYPEQTIDAREQRRRSLQVMLNLLLVQAENQPALVVIEDLHWADPSTREFVELLIGQVPASATLVVLTCRPEFAPSWAGQSEVTPLRLDRLNRDDTHRLLLQLTDGRQLPVAVVRSISDKTDGVPLFVEELTRTLLESKQLKETDGRLELTTSLDQLSIPLTLQESLMARLDKLPAGKRVAQWGAVVGREFSHDLLSAVSRFDQATLQQGLEQLRGAGLLRQRGLEPDARYLFKHALVRDIAYQSILQRQRQKIHGQVADVLQERFPESVAEQPELLAQHYSQAGRIPAAIPYWIRAGTSAAGRWAHQEAIEHLSTGLELLAEQPGTPERAQQELEARIALGPSLMAIRGPADPAVEECFGQARELCHETGETSQLFPVLANLWRFHHSRAQHQKGQRLGEEMLGEGRRQKDRRLQQAAYQMIGSSLTMQGQLAAGCEHLRKSLELTLELDSTGVDARYSADPRLQCLGYLLGPLQYCGYPDQALQKSRQLIALAEGLQHPHSRALMQHHLCILHLNRHDLERLAEHSDAMLALAREHRFPYFLTIGAVQEGWLMAAQGQREGIAQMCKGLAEFEATGARSGITAWRFHLAEAYGMVGRPDDGLQTLTESIELMHRTGERLVEPALYRQQAVLLLQQAAPDEARAEACLLKALDASRQQQSRWWELRTAASLAELWQSQGKPETAYQLLAPVYEWFTEGFDIVFLRQAKALLAQLQA